MNELLRLTLDHHLYLFPLLWGVMWYLNRRGARTGGRSRPRQQLSRQPAPKTTARRSQMPGSAGTTDQAELRARLAALQAQRETLARQIGALEAEPVRTADGAASEPRPSALLVNAEENLKACVEWCGMWERR